ncbi:glucuronate isomerase [Halobacteria archaeon AArc-m2/3/4]|uniref:Uronate isomerase n=1 Tax=Natronoglomus mannanivorans TaxID=2979990 RepID=A0AAP3E376_9EURY|nr:glucuronate isomerase [Halobacteria archaeon AArc-xg1-1]MCU4972284.1 glucuronate isomerase [Halobacteria archaeon AArc-m2/3/4]
MGFLGADYLLETAAARSLYDDIADLPIVDPHNHADVAEIVENDGWNDIWEVEGATDHYVWALMRNHGVSEAKITGDATNREKWDALAAVFPEFAGNPTYEWVHLDLKRRFGIEQTISSETADEIWAETATQLEADDKRPHALLEEMNVDVLCSTDDPTSQLEYHERAVDEVPGVDVLPTWRADRALAVDGDEWPTFVDELADATGIDTGDLDGYREALWETHDYFADHGCVASDLGIREPVSRPVEETRARELYRDALAGDDLADREATDLQAFLLEFVGELNAEKGWTTQFHVGPVRNYREEIYDALGPASGADISTQHVDVTDNLRYFLNTFDGEFETVLYVLDPTHYPSIATLARVFPTVSVGAAWWFNDSPHGIESQLEYAGTIDTLSSHAGMVSDSRKLLSYGSRFEMFRRSLANVVGAQVERGQLPMDVARELVAHVAYDRPMELYGF